MSRPLLQVSSHLSPVMGPADTQKMTETHWTVKLSSAGRDREPGSCTQMRRLPPLLSGQEVHEVPLTHLSMEIPFS